MKKSLLLCLLLIGLFVKAQDKLWKSYFSYNQITDVCIGENNIIASTKNAFFKKNLQTNTFETFTSVNDIKPQEITTIFEASNKNIFIGNENGLIIIVKPDGSVLNKVDVINEVPVPPNQKKINNFQEYNGKIYVATQYGISVINASNLEFESTYYIGSTGEKLAVSQTAVFNNELYAVTSTQGIRRAILSNPFIYDYSQWSTFNSGNWFSLVLFNNQLVGMNSDGFTYKFNGSVPQQIANQGSGGIKLRANNEYLTITSLYLIQVLNTSFSIVNNFNPISNYPGDFTAAVTINDKIFVGTRKYGLFESTAINSSVFTKSSPNGPIEDYSFRIRKTPTDLWLTHGSFNRTYAPDYKLQGISIFNEDGWSEIPSTSLQGAVSLGQILENPKNPKEVYVCSNHSGMLKIIDKTNVSLLSQSNSGLETLTWIPNFVSTRINGLKYDKDGNLWLNNALVNNGLKFLKTNNTIQSVNLSNISLDVVYDSYGNIDIDKNGTKWISTFLNGVVAYNEKYNNKFIKVSEENGLPTTDVRCVAVDKRNQLWIGTFKGLRVLSTDKFISNNEITASNIVIQEGDLAQELFYQQVIQEIVVDGANRKWVSLADAGVFLVSSNGQETIHQFTKNNSPLPSNNILDIEIDEVSGEVFFATDKGLVSFLGTSTRGSDSLANVYAYPNPVRPDFTGTVKISGLMDKVNVKITDIEGNLVFETTSSGGTVEWDTTAFGKYKVASGVYMVFVATKDSTETTVKKIMIVR